MQGTQQMELPQSRETFGSLSHTNSLERMVRRAWERQREGQERAGKLSQEDERNIS
jgi:hypothetical protein